jgi:enterochelin esterase family protein
LIAVSGTDLYIAEMSIVLYADNTSLQPGQSLSGFVDLNKQDLALWHLDAKNFFGSVNFIAPNGDFVRRHGIDGERKRPLAFVADTAGRYQVEVKSRAGKPIGTFSLVLQRIVPLKERLSPGTMARLEGQSIMRLRSGLAEGLSDILKTFWSEVEKRGTPLFDPDPTDPHLTLCTFVWRGDDDTHSVRVELGIDTAFPNDCNLVRMEGTDVWFTTLKLRSGGRYKYQFGVNAAKLAPDGDFDHWEMNRASFQVDPLNPLRDNPDDESPSKYELASLVIMPDAPPQPWIEQRLNVPRGNVAQHRFVSERLGDERTVSVYTPPGYSADNEPYPLLMVFDEQWYLSLVPTPTILDNLRAERRIPPMVAVIIGNGPGNARNRQLGCNPAFSDMLAEELVPWVRKQYNITSAPARTVVAGASLGGLASTYSAWRHPEVFGNVLSQSGSYWWLPDPEPGQPHNVNAYKEPNYVAEMFIQSPRLPVRFFIGPGTEERDSSGNGVDILLTSRTLKNVLLAKGYEVGYSEFVGGHDFLNWRGTLADGLIFLTSSWSSIESASCSGGAEAGYHQRP